MSWAAEGRPAGRTPTLRIELGVREARPELPNLRDHGMTVDRDLLRIVGNLMRLHGGYALVSESSLRAMIHQDTGHLPGVGTVPAAMRRIERRTGRLEVRWIHRGSVRPDGKIATVGCLRARLVFRRERRAVASLASRVNRREDAGARVAAALPTFAPVARELPRADGRVGSDEKRARDLARLAEWAEREGVT